MNSNDMPHWSICLILGIILGNSCNAVSEAGDAARAARSAGNEVEELQRSVEQLSTELDEMPTLEELQDSLGRKIDNKNMTCVCE